MKKYFRSRPTLLKQSSSGEETEELYPFSSTRVIPEDELYQLLKSCTKGSRNSQDKLYKHFYGYSMSICLRYSKTREEALEIANDGFVKVFTKMDKYTRGMSFKGWIRKIMINSAIDYYRKHEKHYHSVDISYVKSESLNENALDKLSAQEIMSAIQELPPSYRVVFNLFVIEGYKHEEIAEQLGISVGTSKSNLAVARSKLRRALSSNEESYQNHG